MCCTDFSQDMQVACVVMAQCSSFALCCCCWLVLFDAVLGKKVCCRPHCHALPWQRCITSDVQSTHRTFFQYLRCSLQQAAEEEDRRVARPNYAMSEDMTGIPSGPGIKKGPLRELARTESILSTQSTRRNYAYTMAAADANPTRKHLNTFSVSLPSAQVLVCMQQGIQKWLLTCFAVYIASRA